MKTRLDSKSAFLGLLLGVTVSVTIAATKKPFVSGAFSKTDQIGRFQATAFGMGTEPSTSHGCYIIDTSTGDLWLIGGAPNFKEPNKVSGPLE